MSPAVLDAFTCVILFKLHKKIATEVFFPDLLMKLLKVRINFLEVAQLVNDGSGVRPRPV